MTDKLNRHARALAKIGASKGGKARASVLTPEERKEIAQKAIRTRWAKAKGIPLEEVGQVSNSVDLLVNTSRSKPSGLFSMFHGELTIGDVVFPCHVLNDGKRVITQREVVGLMTGHAKGGIARRFQTTGLSTTLKI